MDELEEMFTSVEKKIDPGAEKKEKKKVFKIFFFSLLFLFNLNFILF